MGATTTKKTPVIHLYGDSLTKGYVTMIDFYPYTTKLEPYIKSLPEDHPFYAKEVYNFGENGYTTAMIKYVFNTYYNANKDEEEIKAVFIMGGTNDLASLPKAEDVIEQLKEMYDVVRASGVLLVAMSIPDAKYTEEEYVGIRREVNAWIKENVEQEGGIFVDMETIRYSKDIYRDALHFNEQGYDAVADLLIDTIKAYVTEM